MKVSAIAATALLGGAAVSADAHIYDLYFSMAGDRVVPGTDSSAFGRGLFRYNHHGFQYQLDLYIEGVTLDDLLPAGPNGTPLHIYEGRRGENGDIRLDPSFVGSAVEDSGGVRFTTDWVLMGGVQGAFETNIFRNEDALYDGHMYIQLYTQDYPDGAIRGQLPHFGHFLKSRSGPIFEEAVGPPRPIPAAPTLALLAGAGLTAVRRRR